MLIIGLSLYYYPPWPILLRRVNRSIDTQTLILTVVASPLEYSYNLSMDTGWVIKTNQPTSDNNLFQIQSFNSSLFSQSF